MYRSFKLDNLFLLFAFDQGWHKSGFFFKNPRVPVFFGFIGFFKILLLKVYFLNFFYEKNQESIEDHRTITIILYIHLGIYL